jgi:hypothetical protein
LGSHGGIGISAETIVPNASSRPASRKSFFIMVEILLVVFEDLSSRTPAQPKARTSRRRGGGRQFLKPEHHCSSVAEKYQGGLVSKTDLVYYLTVEMTGTEADDALDRGAVADVWRHTLSQIPAVFGRLVYLSALRNPNSGRYEHHGLALVFGPDEASRALKKSHKQVFADWLRFNIEQQMADLELYLSDLPEDKKTVLRAWTKLMPYKNLVPSNARTVETRLYLSDLKAILETLRRAHGVGDLDPDS